MIVEHITSLKNQNVLAWRSLKEAKGRKAHKAFLVEGQRMVDEALSSAFPLQALLIRDGYLDPQELPDRFPSLFTEESDFADRDRLIFFLPEHVFDSVCDTKTPQGIAAVLGEHQVPLTGSRLIALDGLQDPGNVGTILRTADAAGFDGVILSPDCADIFSPKVLRATMGSVFRVGLAFPRDLPARLADLKAKGYSILSSQLDGTPFYDRENVAEKLVLVVGNEGNGVSEAVRRVATHHLRLPMRGGAESLNAAIAAGIMMYELMRT